MYAIQFGFDYFSVGCAALFHEIDKEIKLTRRIFIAPYNFIAEKFTYGSSCCLSKA